MENIVALAILHIVHNYLRLLDKTLIFPQKRKQNDSQDYNQNIQCDK